MEQDPVNTVREDYDRIAEEYARRIFRELDGKPLDRELLRRFANAVRGRGPVCDMGSGPGHVAGFLRDADADVFGLDLSPQMVSQARRLNPDIEFREGNMLALDLPDGTLAGIAAFYAIVNIPMESLPIVLAEMFRVLMPGGLLLLAFHIGDEVIRPQELWGNPIKMEFYHLQPERILTLLTRAGFAIEDVIERDPYAPDVEYQSRRAYVFAKKPAVRSQT
jgi:ubiquinone/menaquinone biosynthesis C-methylase UbiE